MRPPSLCSVTTAVACTVFIGRSCWCVGVELRCSGRWCYAFSASAGRAVGVARGAWRVVACAVLLVLGGVGEARLGVAGYSHSGSMGRKHGCDSTNESGYCYALLCFALVPRQCVERCGYAV